ncbi:MAG: HDIG domain-containing protein [Candidatus Dormibacteraeota bacterium]|nr:HDIG domain-containing protein [Candidatus Dormibacteraeota bacterium]
MTIAALVLACALLIAGVVVLLGARRRRETSEPATHPGASVAEARLQASAIVEEARLAALRTREATLEELAERRAAAESRDAMLDERERYWRERRRTFDDRRFAFKKRREEMDARRAAVDAERERIDARRRELAGIDVDRARELVVESVEAELAAEHRSRVDDLTADIARDPAAIAANRITEAIQRQDAANVDTAPRMSPVAFEKLDDAARERLLSALQVIADSTGMELGVDEEKAHATLRGVDPVGREVARQAAIEALDRRIQAKDVPPLLDRASRTTSRRIREIGDRALWQMRVEGRPELAEYVGTLHYRFSYGQNALLHCQETGYLCSVLAAELGLPFDDARVAGMLHDVGKAVDHDVEGVHAIIGGELLRVLGSDPGIVHAVKAHHFDEEPSTDLAMLTICADAISASRPGARRDTLTTYLARLEQLQAIATRHAGVERAYPLQAGREVRIFVKATAVGDSDLPPLTHDIAQEIEAEMQYPGVIKVTVIRETLATATAPAQIAPVRAGNGNGNGHEPPPAEPG